MNLKEAAQKIEDEYPSIEIFSSVVESAALLHDYVYDIYGLADLCSEEELAEVSSISLSIYLRLVIQTIEAMWLIASSLRVNDKNDEKFHMRVCTIFGSLIKILF